MAPWSTFIFSSVSETKEGKNPLTRKKSFYSYLRWFLTYYANTGTRKSICRINYLMCIKKHQLFFLRCKSFVRYGKYYIQWLLLLFLALFSASFLGSDILIFLTRLAENGFIRKCFMRYTNFALEHIHQVLKSASADIFLFHNQIYNKENVSGYSRNPCSLNRERDAA